MKRPRIMNIDQIQVSKVLTRTSKQRNETTTSKAHMHSKNTFSFSNPMSGDFCKCLDCQVAILVRLSRYSDRAPLGSSRVTLVTFLLSQSQELHHGNASPVHIMVCSTK